jgi:hypothetical protein
MRKTWFAFLIMAILSLTLTSLAFAEHAEPLGGCPDGFHLHHTMDHDEEHEHQHRHIGLDADLNADGYMCARHLSNDLHVHIDNFAQLP